MTGIYFGRQTQKKNEAIASGAKGQFYKNTVYFVRDMPYSCFLPWFKRFGFLASFQQVHFHRGYQ